MLWALLWLALASQATYTDDDVPKSQRLPRNYVAMEYREPVLKPWLLPYQKWEAEYRNYFRRHYQDASLTFKPTMIVMHYTVIDSAAEVYRFFVKGCTMSAGDFGYYHGHASVQLMIDKDGTIYQLLPLDRRCTGAYGVNHVALSIEMVARDEAALLSRPRQVFASFCLVRSLMRDYGIPLSKVVSHSEVGAGKTVVREYTDHADSTWPDRYPPASKRLDPGPTYMTWLRSYLTTHGPAPARPSPSPR